MGRERVNNAEKWVFRFTIAARFIYIARLLLSADRGNFCVNKRQRHLRPFLHIEY